MKEEKHSFIFLDLLLEYRKPLKKRSNEKMYRKRVRKGESRVITVSQMDFGGQGELE